MFRFSQKEREELIKILMFLIDWICSNLSECSFETGFGFNTLFDVMNLGGIIHTYCIHINSIILSIFEYFTCRFIGLDNVFLEVVLIILSFLESTW